MNYEGVSGYLRGGKDLVKGFLAINDNAYKIASAISRSKSSVYPDYLRKAVA